VVAGKLRVAVHPLVVAGRVDGHDVGPAAAALVDVLPGVVDDACLEEREGVLADHLAVDAEVLQAGIPHAEDDGRGKGADADLDAVAVAHDGNAVVGDRLLDIIGLDVLLGDVGPLVLRVVHVHLDEVVDLVDGQIHAVAALAPGVVRADLADELLAGLGDDHPVVDAVAGVHIGPLRHGAGLDAPVHGAFGLFLPVEAGVLGVHADGPSPVLPVDALVPLGHQAAGGGQDEGLVQDVVLGFHVGGGAEVVADHDRLVPDLDVVQVAGAGTEACGQGFHAGGRIGPGAAAVDPFAGLDHFRPLLGGDRLVPKLLLHGRRHPDFLFVCDFLLRHSRCSSLFS